MGACNGKPQASAEDMESNRAINKELLDDRKRLESEVKLLILGAGESGKSTIFKQMRILHLNGFTDEDRQGYKATIYNNTIGSMRVLVSACQELEVEVEDRHKEVVDRIYSGDHYFQGQITSQIADDIESLWTDKGIKAVYERSAEFQLNDSAAYFFENVRRMAEADYLPSDQDILRSRAKTTGIVETSFKLESITFRMIDVGGQRSERKKWLHCFQDITSAIFCVATPEYDLKLYEDDITNRMHESIRLFREICNNKWFVDTSTILFLNKDDLFKEKIAKVDLNVCFPSYTGGCNYEKAIKFITEQFLAQNENPKKQIYPHVTCATDTENIEKVFAAVKDTILREATEGAIGD
uniref:Uncharacterized protein n=1 Tax=Paramoeba aestuarina TaxID=180227 RepID=A0A6U2ZPA3_9EUKA|mmetsp:Transcript_25963/g.40507  ORF Transcript_25963/g.40507 Transcript_25963/m.40507 type:complete len:354 (+) Transcript_25963:83-1144(+)